VADDAARSIIALHCMHFGGNGSRRSGDSPPLASLELELVLAVVGAVAARDSSAAACGLAVDVVANGDGGGSSTQDKAFVSVQPRRIAVSVEPSQSQVMLLLLASRLILLLFNAQSYCVLALRQ
jgi:hypothetical protein